MSKIPRIGVIGGGTFGVMHCRTFRQLENDGRCAFVGLADIDQSILEQRAGEFSVRTYTDYRRMIDEARPDGVTIATPDHLHRKIALDAIERGVHVFVEKPLDVTPEGCREIIDAAERKNLLLEVDFHKRWDPYHLELRNLAAQGKFGEIEYGYAWMEDRIEVPRDWFTSWAGDSSPAWFLGIHMVDLFRWVADTRGTAVYATGTKRKLRFIGVDAWDAVSMHVRMERGVTFQCQVCWILPDAFEAIVNQGIRVVGGDGIMEVDSQDRGARSCFAADDRMATHNLGFFRQSESKTGQTVYGGYGIDAIADFADNLTHILNGGALEELKGNYPDGYDGLEATRIVAAAHRSLSTGELVDIPD